LALAEAAVKDRGQRGRICRGSRVEDLE